MSDEKKINLLEILKSLVLPVCILFSTIFFTNRQFDFSVKSDCSGKTQSIIPAIVDKKIVGSSINDLVNTTLTHCDTKKIVELLEGLTKISGDVDSQSRVDLQKTATTYWVAVGFVGTESYNFTLRDGAPIKGDVAKGAILKSRWSVNLRTGAAVWREGGPILPQGACFKVSGTRLLTAGDQKQLWAEGVMERCGVS